MKDGLILKTITLFLQVTNYADLLKVFALFAMPIFTVLRPWLDLLHTKKKILFATYLIFQVIIIFLFISFNHQHF